MSAEIISAADGTLPDETIGRLASFLRDGEIVALPTETVYGLGVRYDRPEALERLRRLKGREEDRAFTIHLPDRGAIDGYPVEISPFARRLIDRYWPGPLTLVLPDRRGGSIGFRVPAKELTRDILRQVEAPVVLSSANPTGSKPATTAEELLRFFSSGIRAAVDAGPCPLGEASTVLRLSPSGPEILREGIITLENARRVMGKSVIFVCTGNTCRSPMAEALLRKALSEKYGIPVEWLAAFGYSISSAGLVAGEGSPASAQALQACREAGVDLAGHRSRPLRLELLERADLVLAMSRSHLSLVQELFPEGRDRCRLLDAEGKDIADPFGGSIESYRECRGEIERNLFPLVRDL